MDVLPSLLPFLQPFSDQMTAPTFASFRTLAAGWAFAARHNVTGSLRAGHDAKGPAAPGKHHSAYHRVFAAARWGLDAAGLAMLGLILSVALASGGTVFLVVDDTVCPKRGRAMFGVDSHYDAANTGRKRSNANQSLKRRGHCWVMLGVVVPMPLAGSGYVCLPVLFRLYMNTKAARRNHAAYRGKPDLARELLRVACGRFPHRRFHALVDVAYGGQDTLRSLPANCDLTARWQLNVRLCEPPPTRRAPGKGGPLPMRGKPVPSPRDLLDGRCGHTEVELYGRRRKLRVAPRLACLYTVPGRLLRLVAVEPLTDAGTPRPKHRAFYYSTDTAADAAQVLRWYALRWAVEVAVRDAKQHMGFAQPQGWSEPAVRRTAPALMLLYTAVALWFRQDGHRSYRRPAWPWYTNKSAVSFADMLVTLRTCMLRQHLKANLPTPPRNAGSRNPLRLLVRLARLAR